MSTFSSQQSAKKPPLFRIPRPFVLGFFILFVLVAGVHAVGLLGWLPMAEEQMYMLLAVLRWPLAVCLLIYAIARRSLTVSIFMAMLIGLEVGIDFPGFAKEMEVISKVFLKLIKTVIAPLLFGTLVVGIAGHSNIRQVGRMGWKSLLYFEVVTTIALFIGLGFAHLFGVGKGLDPTAAEGSTVVLPKEDPKSWQQIVEHTFPENIIKSISEGSVLQVVVFSILFGIALLMVSEKARRIMLDFSQSLTDTMFKFTNLIMYLAPLAVGSALAVAVAKFGLSSLEEMGKMILALVCALVFFLGTVLVPIALLVKIPIGKLAKTITEPVMLAFTTSSSESALPKAISSMERFGVPRKVVTFVLPMGYSFNLDGTTLYLSLASIFVMNAAKMDMSFGEQLVMMFTLMLTSKGVAGVSRASLVILTGIAASFNMPEWPIMVIYGVDAIMDMMRTSVNVMGNCLATAVIGKWEREVKQFGVPAEEEQAETMEITA